MRRIAAVVHEGFEMLDYFGPLEMFSMFPKEFEIVVVAETLDPVKASGGPRVAPDAVFADGADYELILLPGGWGTRKQLKNPVIKDWLAAASANAELVMTVCTGSALLAATGVLDGRNATTNKLYFDDFAAVSDKVTWKKSARWVEDGKFFTSSGVSAGMDMSLAVIAKLLGQEQADHAMLEAEYIANPDPSNDPFAVSGEKE